MIKNIMSGIKNVTVIGGGVLGSQIAYHIAFRGFNVTLYDSNTEIYFSIMEQLSKLQQLYKEYLDLSSQEVEIGLDNMTFSDNLLDAVSNADLVIESVPENPEIKKQLFTELSQILPERTILATNSSTMLPSNLMDFTGRPDRFLALHFSNLLYRSSIVEVMGSAKTNPEVFDNIVKFSEEIKMYPVVLKKEQPGYVLNSLLMPLLAAASELLNKGIADVETIDKTWRIATNSLVGPFQIYDFIGLNTIYNIAKNNTDVKSKFFAHYLNENYIKKGKMGYLSGEGFYKYSQVK